MAKDLGCQYIARTERLDAKAGNLNHALARTHGDYIAIFDSDYVPQPDFLEKTLGYFTDAQLAFVQTPHHYYNVDSFQFRMRIGKRDKWNEQDVFYRLMMPGRDYWSSAFFAGTSAIFRKRALVDIGGFATQSITEDLLTTIRLYRRKWKGIYHNEVLSSGLAAKDLKSYHTQKQRWAEGNISLLFTDNPLWTSGLSIPQRVCFFSTVFGWLAGFPALIYFIAPAVLLMTRMFPIHPLDWAFLWRYVVFLSITLIGFKIASRGYGRLRYDQAYNMLNFFLLIKAAVKSFLRLPATFLVTNKGRGEAVTLRAIMPQIALVLLCLGAVPWAVFHIVYQTWDGLDRLDGSLGLAIPVFWTAINALLAISAIKSVTAPIYHRYTFRFLGSVAVEYASETATPMRGLGISQDLNESGLSLMTFQPLQSSERLILTLHLGSRPVECHGAIVFHDADKSHGGYYVYGIQFIDIRQSTQDLIIQHCFESVLPNFLRHFDRRDTLTARAVFWYYNRRRIRARAPRQTFTLPLIVRLPEDNLFAVSEDVSRSGLSLISHVPLKAGEHMPVEMMTPVGRVYGEVEIRHSREVVAGRSYHIGCRLLALSRSSSQVLVRLLASTARSQAA
jgi:cellulose synthase (UDP-forming)